MRQTYLMIAAAAMVAVLAAPHASAGWQPLRPNAYILDHVNVTYNGGKITKVCYTNLPSTFSIGKGDGNFGEASGLQSREDCQDAPKPGKYSVASTVSKSTTVSPTTSEGTSTTVIRPITLTSTTTLSSTPVAGVNGPANVGNSFGRGEFVYVVVLSDTATGIFPAGVPCVALFAEDDGRPGVLIGDDVLQWTNCIDLRLFILD